MVDLSLVKNMNKRIGQISREFMSNLELTEFYVGLQMVKMHTTSK